MDLKITCSEKGQANQPEDGEEGEDKNDHFSPECDSECNSEDEDLVLVSCVLCIPHSAVIHLQ